MTKIIALFVSSLCLATTSMAASLPEAMVKSLSGAKETYVSYSAKNPAEILDHAYDQSEVTLLMKFDLGEIFEIIYGKDAVVRYRLETVKDLAEVFSPEQLAVLPQMAKEASSVFSNPSQAGEKNAAYFSLALRWKKNEINESKVLKALSKNPFKR